MVARFNVREALPTNLQALTELIAALESVPEAVPRVAAKAHQRMLLFSHVPAHTAMILKQELLAGAGDALIATHVYLGQAEPTPIVAWASERTWRSLVQKFKLFPLTDCQALAVEISAIIDINQSKSLVVAGRTWTWGERTLVMGIVNATPDSFSNDGLLGRSEVDTQLQAFVDAGVDILDIGGESTRPGAITVSVSEELERVLPMIVAATQFGLPISIDTYKAEVAAAALDAGAHMVNDIWGLRTPEGAFNQALAQVVAERNVPIMLMHNRRAKVRQTALGGHFTDVEYQDLLAEICADLRLSVNFALEQGIQPGQIILDPGLGFGKTPTQNIEVLQRLHEIKSLGYPMLVGPSRKSFIGLALNASVEERVFGTAATVTYAIAQGADIIRVHDVAAMVDVCRMSDALLRSGAWKRLTDIEDS